MLGPERKFTFVVAAPDTTIEVGVEIGVTSEVGVNKGVGVRCCTSVGAREGVLVSVGVDITGSVVVVLVTADEMVSVPGWMSGCVVDITVGVTVLVTVNVPV